MAVLSLAAIVARAEIVEKGGVRVSVTGALHPTALPRHGTAPVAVSVGGRIGTADGSQPPQLQRITIEINRHGRLDNRGLPICRVDQIQPSSNRRALSVCRHSLVGEGTFTADVVLPQQSPFPSRGKILAFNGRMGGRPAILAHVFGTQPAPTSYTLAFLITRIGGTYGTKLSAFLPLSTGDWGFVTGLVMTLKRSYTYRGVRHSYLSAGCPAPSGFPGAVFSLVRTSFLFEGERNLSAVLTKSCKVR